MNGELLAYADRPITPWRNGGGITRELACAPAEATEFDWRISIAEVGQSGRFSRFPGVDRVIVLCQGAAMVLDVDGVHHELRRYVPLHFTGEASVDCHLPDGPTRDLNVMTRRTRCTAQVSVIEISQPRTISTSAGAASVLVALSGHLTCVSPGSAESVTLARFDALRLAGADAMTVHGQGHLAVVAIDENNP